MRSNNIQTFSFTYAFGNIVCNLATYCVQASTNADIFKTFWRCFWFKSQFNLVILVHFTLSLHIMNWCRTHKMSQHEPIRTQFNYTYVKRHNHGSVHWYPIPHNLTHCLSFFHLPLAKQLNWYADQATPSPRWQLCAWPSTLLCWLDYDYIATCIIMPETIVMLQSLNK